MELSNELRFEEIESMAAPDSDFYAGFKLAFVIGIGALIWT